MTLALVAAGAVTGALGAMLGIGGGVVLVPLLVLGLNVPLSQAIPASLLCVVASSCMAAAGYVRTQLSDMRLALTLELATVTGAICGGFVAGLLSPSIIALGFGLFCSYVALQLWMFAPARAAAAAYVPRRMPLGIGGSFVAGSVSSVLGVGGGPLKVPLMAVGMGVPFKVAAATSNLMVGVTAAASLSAYAWRETLPLHLAAPLIVGVLLGAPVGMRLLLRAPPVTLRRVFATLMVVLGVQMLWKGGQGLWMQP